MRAPRLKSTEPDINPPQRKDCADMPQRNRSVEMTRFIEAQLDEYIKVRDFAID